MNMIAIGDPSKSEKLKGVRKRLRFSAVDATVVRLCWFNDIRPDWSRGVM